MIEQSINEIIPTDKSPQEWEIMYELTGIRNTEYIIEFTKMLDEKISKADNVNQNDVGDILDFFGVKDWRPKNANPRLIKSFHDWFCALDDCLERLRGALQD